MAGAVFPPCCLTWSQTMVEVVKIMVTSFKRSHPGTAALSAPNPVAGYHWHTLPLETPGHSQESLGQSLVGSLLLSPGSWCTRGFVCALQESVSPVLCKFWWLYGGVNGDLLQEGLCHIQVCCTQSPCPCRSPLLTHTFAGDTQTQFWPSFCGVSGSWCTQGFVWALWTSLAIMGFDSKHDFALPTILLGLLLCPWTWGIFFLVGWNIVLSMIGQQWIVILEFLQEKINVICKEFYFILSNLYAFFPPCLVLLRKRWSVFHN